jgi:putative DNA primase/helicase
VAVAYIWPKEWQTPLDAALYYAGVGWKVFPCYLHTNFKTGKKEKKPRVAWTNVATTDAAQIERWWKRWPDALIGHLPGSSGHVVIDIDVKNGGKGDEQWRELNGSLGLETMSASSLSGGTHLWYKKAPFDHIKYFYLSNDIEVRSDTVYVILPSPGSGYEWTRRREPKDMPLWLVRRITENELLKANKPDGSDVDMEVDYDSAKIKFLKLLRGKNAVKTAERPWLKLHVLEKNDQPKNDKGERSDVLYRMECLLRDLGMSEGETWALVWRSGWCKFRTEDKQRPEQLAREIAKVYSEEAGNDNGESADDDDAEPSTLTWLIDVIVQSNRFLWWPYLPEGEAVILAGPGGVGKGLAAGDWAARVTRGKRWPLSKDRAPTGNVLWVEEEDSVGKTLRPRLEAMGADLSKILIMSATQFKERVTRKFIIEHGIRLIILSPLLSCLELESSINEIVVREELVKLADLFRDLPVTLLGLMHPNKKHDQSAIDRVSGTTAFTTFPRCTLIINREKPKSDDEDEVEYEDRFRLTHQKHNLSKRGHDLIGVRVNTREQDDPRGQWLAVEWEEAEEDIDTSTALDRKREKKEGGDASAGAWLVNFLTVNGATLRSAVVEEAAKRGYSEAALNKAVQRNPKIKHTMTKEMPAKAIWEYVK